ncbi:hypothetical protein [Parasphingorhabdus sp.]|uniref:hypothetical protein n=1 Tax=Parasphingorhabdus sp. TaxID=2709688 RepID=UPI002F925768
MPTNPLPQLPQNIAVNIRLSSSCSRSARVSFIGVVTGFPLVSSNSGDFLSSGFICALMARQRLAGP